MTRRTNIFKMFNVLFCFFPPRPMLPSHPKPTEYVQDEVKQDVQDDTRCRGYIDRHICHV